MDASSHRLQIRLTGDLVLELDELAKVNHASRAQVIRYAIRRMHQAEVGAVTRAKPPRGPWRRPFGDDPIPAAVQERARRKFAEVCGYLAGHRTRLEKRYELTYLSVFGSYVRGDASLNSDLDFLVDFAPDMSERMRVQLAERLERELGDALFVRCHVTDLDHLDLPEGRDLSLEEFPCIVPPRAAPFAFAASDHYREGEDDGERDGAGDLELEWSRQDESEDCDNEGTADSEVTP